MLPTLRWEQGVWGGVRMSLGRQPGGFGAIWAECTEKWLVLPPSSRDLVISSPPPSCTEAQRGQVTGQSSTAGCQVSAGQ